MFIKITCGLLFGHEIKEGKGGKERKIKVREDKVEVGFK